MADRSAPYGPDGIPGRTGVPGAVFCRGGLLSGSGPDMRIRPRAAEADRMAPAFAGAGPTRNKRRTMPHPGGFAAARLRKIPGLSRKARDGICGFCGDYFQFRIL